MLINQINFCARKKIEYQNPSTVSSAKALGNRCLNGVKYDGFESDSLQALNFINQGLVLAQNSSRKHLRMPNYIDFIELEKAQMSTKYMGGILEVNKNIYDEATISNEIIRISKEMLKDGVLVQNEDGYFLNEVLENDEAKDFLANLKIKFSSDLSTLTYEEKLELYHSLRVFYEQTSQLNRFPKDLIIKMFEASCWGEFDKDIVELFSSDLKSAPNEDNFIVLFNYLKEFGEINFNFDFDTFKYRTIFHEVGHLQDIDLFYEPNVEGFSSYENYPKELKSWLNDKENLKIAFSVSPYACYGKGEFFAECYSMLLQGRKLSPEAQELYEKIGGIKVYLS